jgi:hypothetical protein
MDPFIEACGLWEDFHDSLVIAMKHALAKVLPERYSVRSGERAYIVLAPRDGESIQEAKVQADVAVTRHPTFEPFSSGDTSQAAVARETATLDAPIAMRALVETEHRESFLEIRELNAERRLVTVMEVLSPANKRYGTPGWAQYLRKRQALLEGLANFVEVDLLSGGQRLPMEDEWPSSPYYILVARKEEAPLCKVWPLHFSRAVPEIGVPLLPPDPDVSLALQPLIQEIYRESKYFRDIDYSKPSSHAITAAAAAWLAEQQKGGGV